MKRIAVISMIGIMMALAACGGGSQKASNSPTPTASLTRLASTGHLTIVSPTPNEVIHGSTLHVKVTLTGARIVSQTTNAVTPDTGHIHVSIDGKITSQDFDQTNLNPLEQTIGAGWAATATCAGCTAAVSATCP